MTAAIVGLLVLLIVVRIAVAVANARPSAPSESSPQPSPPASAPVPEPGALGTLVERPLVRELESPKPGRFRWAVVAGRDGEASMPALDRLGEQQGWVAVFVGAEKELPEFSLHDDDPQSVLALAEAIDATDFLAGRLDEYRENAEGAEPPLGEWPEEDDDVGEPPYGVFSDILTKAFHERVYIALVPAREAWMAPAFLQNGGWNEVPDAATQVAVVKYWHERHGARLRAFSNDVMELEVDRPPQDPEASLALATEQYAFCPDVVDQGMQALRPLAAWLRDKRYWYFWWD
jgi:hypothetical protein